MRKNMVNFSTACGGGGGGKLREGERRVYWINCTIYKQFFLQLVLLPAPVAGVVATVVAVVGIRVNLKVATAPRWPMDCEFKLCICTGCCRCCCCNCPKLPHVAKFCAAPLFSHGKSCRILNNFVKLHNVPCCPAHPLLHSCPAPLSPHNNLPCLLSLRRQFAVNVIMCH